jgi:hypothetical protein
VSQRRLYKNYQFNEEDADSHLNRENPLDIIEEKMKLQEKMLEDKIRLKQEQSKESILDNSNSTYIYLKKNNF